MSSTFLSADTQIKQLLEDNNFSFQQTSQQPVLNCFAGQSGPLTNQRLGLGLGLELRRGLLKPVKKQHMQFKLPPAEGDIPSQTAFLILSVYQLTTNKNASEGFPVSF